MTQNENPREKNSTFRFTTYEEPREGKEVNGREKRRSEKGGKRNGNDKIFDSS
jgi:hypothetical protein